MKKPFIAAGIVLFSVLISPLKATAESFSAMYVFGDSLSDNGNSFAASGGTIPPSPPYFEGHFSNGKIWVEYLAEDLKLKPQSLIDFAFGGATTGTTNNLSASFPGLEQEIDNFVNNTPTADPNALYTIWAGANDYGAGVTDPTVPVSNLANAVTSLASVGAKNIMVLNLPSLGELPGSLNTPNSGPLNTLTDLHNAALSNTLDGLSQSLPDVNLIPIEINLLFNEITSNPSQYGFTNVTEGCLLVSCTNPNQYIFWDAIHPTTKTHKLISDYAAAAINIQPVPEPSTTSGILVLGILGASLIRKRQQARKKFSALENCQSESR